MPGLVNHITKCMLKSSFAFSLSNILHVLFERTVSADSFKKTQQTALCYFACFIDTCRPLLANQLCVDFTCAMMFAHCFFLLYTSSPECECEVKISLHFRCNIEIACEENVLGKVLEKKQTLFIIIFMKAASGLPSRGKSLHLIRNKIQEFVAAANFFLSFFFCFA